MIRQSSCPPLQTPGGAGRYHPRCRRCTCRGVCAPPPVLPESEWSLRHKPPKRLPGERRSSVENSSCRWFLRLNVRRHYFFLGLALACFLRSWILSNRLGTELARCAPLRSVPQVFSIQ